MHLHNRWAFLPWGIIFGDKMDALFSFDVILDKLNQFGFSFLYKNGEINLHTEFPMKYVLGFILLWSCYEFLEFISHIFNSSAPGQNGRHFADDIFNLIFMNGKSCILIRISMKFVFKGPIDNKSALVQVRAWRRTLPWHVNQFNWCVNLSSNDITAGYKYRHFIGQYIDTLIDLFDASNYVTDASNNLLTRRSNIPKP